MADAPALGAIPALLVRSRSAPHASEAELCAPRKTKAITAKCADAVALVLGP
jgi:hypothetical protein